MALSTAPDLVYECINMEYMIKGSIPDEVITAPKKLKTLIESERKFLIALTDAIDTKSESKIKHIENKMNLNEGDLEKFMAYVNSTEVPRPCSAVFSGISGLLREQLSFINKVKEKLKTCDDLYYVAIYLRDKTSPHRTKLIISMFVAVYPELKTQQHFFITKSPYYYLYECLGLDSITPLRNSSILLHSFASSLFGSTEWCTAPIESMTKILEAQGFKTYVPGPDHSMTSYMTDYNLTNPSGKGGCYVQPYITVCVPVKSVSSKYKVTFSQIWNPTDSLQVKQVVSKIFVTL